ncbi:hypothetical protein OUZ56_018726 [Daphnia magna]|uniref:Uncharacterized protein n=1 Tax=Daphnia magna TaxID=35525 RepID=A0ABQ9Z9L1_9CRUS|nr:hypothetical protein OUZ56_018726 [Daphnia magna]
MTIPRMSKKYGIGNSNIIVSYPRARLLLKSIRKCLSLHRHKEQPRNPRDARDDHILLMEIEQYRKQKDGTDFYLGEVLWMDVATGNEESAQVFGNIEVLRVASDPLVKEMHGDGIGIPLVRYQNGRRNGSREGAKGEFDDSANENVEQNFLQSYEHADVDDETETVNTVPTQNPYHGI